MFDRNIEALLMQDGQAKAVGPRISAAVEATKRAIEQSVQARRPIQIKVTVKKSGQ